MLPHWDSVIEPLLRALDRGPVVEIGSAAGETTLKLAELAAERGLVVHAIDPEPRFPVEELERRFGVSFRFHRARSHTVLEQIEAPAAVLIDGDHNWFTVHGELTRLQRSAASAQRPFPLAMLHDVEWPYARRDMYYDPDAIPEQWRKPWARRGLKWGERLLDESGGGANGHLANAIEEGGERNGVLTAVEDFIRESSLPLELRMVHGEAGIGVLASRDLLDAVPPLEEQWERLLSPEFLFEQTRKLAEIATRATVGAIVARHRIERLTSELAERAE